MNTPIVQIATSDTEAERILKGSVLLESEKNAHKKTALMLDTAVKFIRTNLDTFEGKWDAAGTCDSPEEAMDYITQAKWMRKHFGRNPDRVDEVQEWYNNYEL